ncbi:MAG: hypothetical protein AB8G86_13620 [Saprospiraceae bacterium]
MPTNFSVKISLLPLLILPIFLFTASVSFGQNAFATPAGARGIGMGNANLTLKDVYSGFNNPAGLAYLNGFEGAAFVENRFLLQELQMAAISLAQPTNSGTIGMTLQYFGFEDYNEQKVGLNYSRKLFDKLSIGAQFDFLNTRVKEYGNASAITFGIGLQYEILDKLTAGIHVFNPIRATIGTQNLPSIIQIGITYQVADYLTISGAIEKDTTLPYNVKFGLEYQVADKIQLRAGMNSNPNRLSFGVGYLVNQLQLNVAATYHDILGFSPAVGFRFMPKKKATLN